MNSDSVFFICVTLMVITIVPLCHDSGEKSKDREHEKLKAEVEEARRLHHELLYQVDTKVDGETRHETALRWLRQYRERFHNSNQKEKVE